MALTSPPPSSPLSEANPFSLEDLFNKDPLDLTEGDLDRTIKYYRDARQTFLKQDETKAAAPKVPKGPPKKAAPKNLSIDELDL